MTAIGREDEQRVLAEFLNSDVPELLVAIVSASGLKETMYSEAMVNGNTTLNDLFQKD